MKILVFGKNGQVASKLNLESSVISLSRVECDFKNPKNCIDAINSFEIDGIINAAAYTNVEDAESNEEIANTINGFSPAEIAKAAKIKKIPLIHLSTDYVFDGKKKLISYKTSDVPNPINAYGRSKLLGENQIISSGAVYIIIRTSWIFSEMKNNFVHKIIELSKKQGIINVVSDQYGSPTPALEVAKACLKCLDSLKRDKSLAGVYHFSSLPYTNWSNFAKKIIINAKTNSLINPISSSEYKMNALRPKNTKLDNSKIKNKFGIEIPSWEIELKKIVKKIIS